MAMGSANKLEYHLLLSKGLHFLVEEDYRDVQAQVVEVKRMLAGLIRKVAADRSG